MYCKKMPWMVALRSIVEIAKGRYRAYKLLELDNDLSKRLLTVAGAALVLHQTSRLPYTLTILFRLSSIAGTYYDGRDFTVQRQ